MLTRFQKKKYTYPASFMLTACTKVEEFEPYRNIRYERIEKIKLFLGCFKM